MPPPGGGIIVGGEPAPAAIRRLGVAPDADKAAPRSLQAAGLPSLSLGHHPLLPVCARSHLTGQGLRCAHDGTSDADFLDPADPVRVTSCEAPKPGGCGQRRLAIFGVDSGHHGPRPAMSARATPGRRPSPLVRRSALRRALASASACSWSLPQGTRQRDGAPISSNGHGVRRRHVRTSASSHFRRRLGRKAGPGHVGKRDAGPRRLRSGGRGTETVWGASCCHRTECSI